LKAYYLPPDFVFPPAKIKRICFKHIGTLFVRHHQNLISKAIKGKKDMQAAESISFCLQCFDTVGWAAGRASGL